ncbi:glycoside hydrolase family 16 protein [Streptomyces luteolifulvus]|uniref:Glycoside hydrolase family 16 protein n=1 Tax=Streptomyces luteolifulvus TaxID=2615112 RepID=A0A6H9UNH9_9ACTN|nr:glycoside hydrolase family 16 protein [Streptomyces luteolifulvus]KAB1139678.1 glycoside hydrolase family 16 protein [Streptomyces luteolifulvus]
MAGLAQSLSRRTAVALASTGLICTALAGLPGTADAAVGQTGPALFDDFNYTAHTDPLLSQHGWTLRSAPGGPGVPGARWKPQNISFATRSGNSIMNMRSGTTGTAAGTEQTEIYTEPKFHRGTYAARVRFTDRPVYGPDGDHMVQTFFSLSPQVVSTDPAYSELGFEYVPNGGFGIPASALLATSWETYSEEDPAQTVYISTQERRSFAGWHNLVATVDTQRINYYVDGRLFATHTEPYLPESSMTIRFSHWLIDLRGVRKPRAYDEQVDYVYFAKDRVLTPTQVQAAVADYRARRVAFEDTV